MSFNSYCQSSCFLVSIDTLSLWQPHNCWEGCIHIIYMLSYIYHVHVHVPRILMLPPLYDRDTADTYQSINQSINQSIIFFLIVGVNHGHDIFYLFGIPLLGNPLIQFTKTDEEVSRVEMTLYSNFVKFGWVASHASFNLTIYCRKEWYSYSGTPVFPPLWVYMNDPPPPGILVVIDKK